MSHPISTSTSTGTSALQTLLHFNRGWAQRTRAKDSKFFKRLAEKQTPKVLWFGCSDSRVPESVVMDVNPGVIFTHRNIANQFRLDDDSALSALTFALEDLDVQHIVVCGHTGCGGMNEVFKAATASTAKSHAHDHTQHHHTDATGNRRTPLKRWLAPLTRLAIAQGIPVMGEKSGIPKLTIESVKQQVANIASASIVKEIANRKSHSISIHGWIYHLETGELEDLHVSVHVPAVGATYYGRLLGNLREPTSAPASKIAFDYSSLYRPRAKKGKHDLVL